MKTNNLFKILLVTQTIGLVIYTTIVMKNSDENLFQIFLSNIRQIEWNGQFSLDFSCYLLLSWIWITWRNKFSLQSILIATAAAIVGIMVFAPYLLYLLYKEKGDLKKVLIGEN